MKVLFISVAFENDAVISKQIQLFSSLCSSEKIARLVIVDNSKSIYKQLKIRELCRKSGTRYFHVPKNPFTGSDPSFSHGYALNYAAKKVPNIYKAEWVGFLDHDILPLDSIESIFTKLKDSSCGYGVVMRQAKTWYYWPGFCFFKTSKVDLKYLDFLPQPGLDTGGGNWVNLFAKHNRKDFSEAVVVTKYLTGTQSRNKQRDAYQIIDGRWLHLINASNWAGVDMSHKEQSLDALLDKLTLKEGIYEKKQ